MQDGLVALRTRGTYSVGKFYPSQSHSRLGPRPALHFFHPEVARDLVQILSPTLR